MTKKYLIIFVFALILAVVIGFQVLNQPEKIQESPTAIQPESTASISSLEAQTNNEGAVSIAVTPKNLSDKEWVFEIALNTHSMEIDEDLTKVSVLIDGNGNEYRPIGWQGDPPGGHHRSGILQFALIPPQPKSITLKIFQIGGVEERNFIWQLKPR